MLQSVISILKTISYNIKTTVRFKTANIVNNWFINSNIKVMPRPVNSRDLNPIENILGGLIIRKIYKANFQHQNFDKF